MEQVVIARHREGVSHLQWLRDYPHVIYNRGGDRAFKEEGYWLPLKHVHFERNVGRESFIYLSHIIDNYDRLANITVFSQVKQVPMK